MDAVTWAVPAFITVGTFLMSCYLLRSFVVARATMRKYVRVVGVVVDFRSRQVASANTRHPVLAFRTVDGRDVQAESPHGSNLNDDKLGKQVTVVYDPDDPADAYIDSPSGLPTYVYGLGLALTTFIFVIAAVVLVNVLT